MSDRHLSVTERMALIDHHAQCVLQEFKGIQSPERESIMEHINRLDQLAKSLPKTTWAIPR